MNNIMTMKAMARKSNRQNRNGVSNSIGRLIGRRKKMIGALGEALVVKHLKSKGFQHIQSNYLKKQGELDLIMEFEGFIHFFEVKTVSRENQLGNLPADPEVIRETVNRETDRGGGYMPEENVSGSKLRKIARMILIYLSDKRMSHRNWKFHIAVVFLDQKSKKACIKFIKDVPVNI